MNTPNDICSAMRNVRPLSHDDMQSLIANFAAMVQRPSALGDKCSRIVVDMLDEVLGQVDQDKCQQQAEAMWADTNQRAWNDAYKTLGVAA